MSYLLISNNINIQGLVSLYAQQLKQTVDTVNYCTEDMEKTIYAEFDAVLLDTQTLNNQVIECINALRQFGFTGKLVALSDKTGCEINDSYLAAGCSAVLALPADKNEFISLLSRYSANHDSNDSEQPALMSTMVLDDEVIIQLVGRYVSMLPSLIEEISQAFHSQDFLTFKHLVHDLKATGGNYGYMIITRYAASMEICLRDKKFDNIYELLEDLDRVVKQIQLTWKNVYGEGNTNAVNQ